MSRRTKAGLTLSMVLPLAVGLLASDNPSEAPPSEEAAWAWLAHVPEPLAYQNTIHVNGRDWQEVIDEAPAYSTLVGDGVERVIGEGGTVRVTKPLRIVKFVGRLEDGVGGTPILQVDSEGVVVEEFRLYGNHGGSVPYANRATLLLLTEGRFLVQNGYVENATKHGIETAAGMREGHLEDGIIRDIVSRDVRRDAVSINGKGDLGRLCRNILVENITAYGSPDRGAVEVVDGTHNVTVRNVRCHECQYGVDVQDHNREGQVNTLVTIEGVHVTRTPSAIITANAAHGHRHLTLRNISGEDWPEPTHRRGRTRGRIDVTHTDQVLIENVRILGDSLGTALSLTEVEGAVVRDVFVQDHRANGFPAVDLLNVSGVRLEVLHRSGTSLPDPVAILFRNARPSPPGSAVFRGVDDVTGERARIELVDPEGARNIVVTETALEVRRQRGAPPQEP